MAKQKNPYVKQLETLLEKHQTVEGEQPLECLVSIYQKKTNPLGMRLAAAGMAAPYVHRKMPVAIEHDVTITNKLAIVPDVTLRGVN